MGSSMKLTQISIWYWYWYWYVPPFCRRNIQNSIKNPFTTPSHWVTFLLHNIYTAVLNLRTEEDAKIGL